MIFGKKYWFKKTVDAWKPSREFAGWDKATKIGIVIPQLSGADQSVIDKIVDEWRHNGRHTHILKISEQKMSKKKESIREHNTLYANESSWKGIPSSPDFNEFISHRYDLVLQLCTESKGLIPLIPYMINAGLVVGPTSADAHPYDLQVVVEDRSWKDVFNEIENWLKKIKYVA